MIEAIHFEKLSNNKALSHICQRRCVIKENERGYCFFQARLGFLLEVLVVIFAARVVRIGRGHTMACHPLLPPS